MKDIATLRKLIHPRTWVQVRIALVCCSGAGIYFGNHYGLPWGMIAFIAVFFMLPLIGAKLIRRNIEMALEAYDGNQSVGGQARWRRGSRDTSVWSTAWLGW